MAKFIKLHSECGDECYVNIDLVAEIHPVGTKASQLVYPAGSQKEPLRISVEETPAQIISIINDYRRVR